MSHDPNADGLAESAAGAAAPVVVPPSMLEPALAIATATEGPHVSPGAHASIQQNIIITHHSHGPGLFVRAIWYVFIGWWLTGLAITFAIFCSFTVILLPIAYMIVNKIPVILTLRPRSIESTARVDADGTIRVDTGGAAQLPFWQRGLWFLVIGWWACAVVMYFAYLLCLSIILIPVGLMIFNRVPAVLTLQRN